jgi:hypothetical protein
VLRIALVLLFVSACGEEPAPPAPVSTVTDVAFGHWANTMAEAVRNRAVQAANEEDRAQLESDKVLGVAVSLRYFVGDRGFVIRALAMRDFRVRYFAFGGWDAQGAEAWPETVPLESLREMDEYVRFTIEHHVCDFALATREEWTEGTGDRARYDPRRPARASCSWRQRMITDGARPDRTIGLTVFFEHGRRSAEVRVGDNGVSFVDAASP